MKITTLKLLNFRNYKKLSIEFDPSKNIIIGQNGMGKTNIVEALYCLAMTKSFRGTHESVVINKNADLARIEGEVTGILTNNYKIIIKDKEKKVKINNTNYKLSDYLSRINIILFTSQDLKLIKDTPGIRRKLINIELSQFNNEYLKLLNKYNHLIKQRNAYLKELYYNGNASRNLINIYTEQLIDYGLIICNFRNKFINDLSEYLEENYYKITGNHGLKIVYKSDFLNKGKEDLLKLYEKELNKDIALGKTNIGIHRDDFEFFFEDNNLKDYGSEGEQKNAIISFKMAELEIFKVQKGEVPILVLDDLFSELDENKINNIIKFISNDVQTFITTTEIDKVSKKLLKDAKIFEVNDGIVTER